MMDLLGTGSAWAQELRTDYGSTATYVRYSTGAEITIKYTPGKTEFEDDKMGMGIIITRLYDFIVNMSDLVDDGTPFEPVANDLIRATVSGVAREFRVAPDAGDALFTPHDNRRETIRIHTKEVTPSG